MTKTAYLFKMVQLIMSMCVDFQSGGITADTFIANLSLMAKNLTARQNTIEGQPNSAEQANYAIGLCTKKQPLYCVSFDPASATCCQCKLRPTA